MQEMLEYIVKNLVSNPDAVEIAVENQGKTKVFKVKVDDKDLGSVIGRGGCIANAIRTVVKSTSNKERLVIKFDAK
ncbi:MAG: KH domain-containing protein [Clostridia bacterium]|nr:KH domain-containing protein [Clostridia bacterium]